jgi:hypothetical protein
LVGATLAMAKTRMQSGVAANNFWQIGHVSCAPVGAADGTPSCVWQPGQMAIVARELIKRRSDCGVQNSRSCDPQRRSVR